MPPFTPDKVQNSSTRPGISVPELDTIRLSLAHTRDCAKSRVQGHRIQDMRRAVRPFGDISRRSGPS